MEIKNIPIDQLKHYERNRNIHPEDQIARLADLIKAHGFRDPLTVDQDTMEVITGNGTMMACKLLGMKEIPCVLQKFESDEQRYAFSISHNAISQWATLDFSGIHQDLPALDGFNIDLLGIKGFNFEPIKIDIINKGDENSSWASLDNAPDFTEGGKYINLIYQFETEEAREDFVMKNNLEITLKKSNQWIIKK